MRNNREGPKANMVDKLDGHGIVRSVGSNACVCAVCAQFKVKSATTGRTPRTHNQCVCGTYVCNPGTQSKSCFMVHMLTCVAAEHWANAAEFVKDPAFDL